MSSARHHRPSLKITLRQKRYNIIIFVMYEATRSFLNGRHLSSGADDAGYLLPIRASRCFHARIEARRWSCRKKNLFQERK